MSDKTGYDSRNTTKIKKLRFSFCSALGLHYLCTGKGNFRKKNYD